MNTVLYLITWLSWGGSWLAIKWQEGHVPIVQSIAYRFALAGLLLIVTLFICNKLHRTNWRDHLFFALQGSFLFSFNFVAFYNATFYIDSGLVAVVMSTAIIMNAILGHFFWQQQPKKYLKLAAPLGGLGLALLFWPELSSESFSVSTVIGIACALAGTLCFSLGNMVSIRHTQVGLDTLTSNAWSMLYGCLLMIALNALQGNPLMFDLNPRYIGALFYLAVIASVLAFPAYLLLVQRIGASSAAYVLVATPILALSLSSYFEGYQWVWTGALGMVVIVIGNMLILTPEQLIDRAIRFIRSLCESGQTDT